MKRYLPLFAFAATPAFAASGPFVSLHNTNFVVLLAFIVFIAVLVYFKVPKLLGEMLDRRSAKIQADLDEARSLREEAQKLLASYERKHKEMQAQAVRIVEAAKKEAAAAAEEAKADLQDSIARRLAGAEEQIAQAEANAIKEVRNRAVTVAVAAARQVLSEQMTKDRSGQLIDSAIDEVDAKLH
ncbi:MAG: F0F1 ATP synthase subunit B [Rhodobacteraceae bacterium]|nr:F0F1 ATP synthase subunit B [Paracoccaceae bacterium]